MNGAPGGERRESLKTPTATVPASRLVPHDCLVAGTGAPHAKLGARTLQVRAAFEKARSPERFLYVELPEALDLPPFIGETADRDAVEEFFQRLNACNEEWAGVAGVVRADARKALLQACGFEPTDKGWQELREAAGRLEPGERDPQFRLVLQRIVESTPDEAGAAPVLSLIAGRPIENWLDEDIDRFPERGDIGEPVRQAVARMAGGKRQSSVGLSKAVGG